MTLNLTKGFCVLVRLILRLIYHAENEFLDQTGDPHLRTKRQPMTTLTLNVLLGAILVRMGTGMASMSPEVSIILDSERSLI